MKPLQQDDPRRIGPFAAFARLRESASAVRYLAHRADGGADAPVVVSLARPELAALPEFRQCFEDEVRTADRLAGSWVPPRAGASAADDASGNANAPQLWTAWPYVPAVSVAEAVALAGPLPEHAVRTLGAGLAETLSRAHATGTVLHALNAETVLLSAGGPLLTAFGALGSAAHVEAGDDGRLSTHPVCPSPEQLSGDRPGTPADIFALGLLLAYAATGRAPGLAQDGAWNGTFDAAELQGVPEALRGLVADCLSWNAAQRPTAGAVAAALSLAGAAALVTEGWLPEPVTAALATQAAAVSGAGEQDGVRRGPRGTAQSGASGTAWNGVPGAAPDVDVRGAAQHPLSGGPFAPAGPGPQAAPPAPGTPAPPGFASLEGPAPSGIGGTGTAAPLPGHGHPGVEGPGDQGATAPLFPAARTPSPAEANDYLLPTAAAASASPFGTGGDSMASAPRSTVTASVLAARADARRRVFVAAGVAGTAGLLLGGGIGFGAASGFSKESDGTGSSKPRTVPGAPPAPLWSYQHSGEESVEPVVWRNRVLVLAEAHQCTGVDLRTGRHLWTQSRGRAAFAPVLVGDSVFVVGPTEFIWLSADDGAVESTSTAPGHVTAIAGFEGSVVWFSGTVGAATYLFAYDMKAKKELWRSQVPNGRSRSALPEYQAVAVMPDGILVRQDSDSLTQQQTKASKGLALFSLHDRKSGQRVWSKYLVGVSDEATVVGDASGRVYAPVRNDLQAFDTTSGKSMWQAFGPATPGANKGGGFGKGVIQDGTLYLGTDDHDLYALETATGKIRWSRSTEASGSGRPRLLLSAGTALTLEENQVTAFSTRDGRRLWKFQSAGSADRPTKSGRYRGIVAGDTAVLWRDTTLYALPLGQ
ncbi:PQQ-binding-like beta-propeller repeat protein [Streptomyces sp. SCSIO 30461]|uniref:outer membrane protein assembly factor BamB family protein n=1 Tax=Streptomyces sp. SCSIO 30461 TaxID=3118085 RepID=UPI0030D35A17